MNKLILAAIQKTENALRIELLYFWKMRFYSRLLIVTGIFLALLGLCTAHANAQTFQEAVDRMYGQDRDAGADIHPGQFGSTIVQYKDHFKECMGLGCAENAGVWRPQEVFNGKLPIGKCLSGQNMPSDDGKRLAYCVHGKWEIME